MPYPKGKPQSEESKQRRREAMLRRIAEGKFNTGFHRASFTPEVVAKRTATNKANGNFARAQAAMSAAMARPDVRAKLSAERKIRFNTEAGRAVILRAAAAAQARDVNERRRAASRAYAETPEGRKAKRRGGDAALHSLRGASAHRAWEYKGHRFRSSWEMRFAMWLDTLEADLPCAPGPVDWEYEPTTFALPDGSRYTPDFLVHLPNYGALWVEIKGPYCPDKFWVFHEMMPNSVMLGVEHMDALP